jgi:hypothetical protein
VVEVLVVVVVVVDGGGSVVVIGSKLHAISNDHIVSHS